MINISKEVLENQVRQISKTQIVSDRLLLAMNFEYIHAIAGLRMNDLAHQKKYRTMETICSKEIHNNAKAINL